MFGGDVLGGFALAVNHLGRALDCAALIGASKQEICNDVIIMSAAHIIGYKERRYQAPRQGGASSPRENRLRSQVTAHCYLF